MPGTLTGLPGAMTRARRWTRWPDWVDSKLAWLGTSCYYLALIDGWSLAHTVAVMLRVLPFVVGLAALGYAANDYWDREADVAAGKRAPDVAPSPAAHRRLVAGLLGATLVATVPLAPRGSSLVVGLMLLVLAVAYSAPPVRLKVRGAWGLLVGALAQWGTPPLPLLVGRAAPTAGFALLLALGLSAGLRWMLLHQILDAPGDARAGIRTFTTDQGVPRAMAMLRGLVGLEVGLLVTWGLVAGPLVPAVALVPGVYLLACWLVARRLRRDGLLPEPAGSYERAPLRGLYLAWLPLSFLIALMRVQPSYGWLVVLELWWKRYQLAGDLRLVCRAAGLPPPWSR
jgi:4-hydroxybenzoate polyprenyltransferase